VSSAAEWTLRIGLFVFCAFPLYWMLVSSLKVSHELLASPPTFWPHEWDLRPIGSSFYETNFWKYFQNTIVVSASPPSSWSRPGHRRLQPDPLRVPRPDPRGRMTLLAYMFPPIIMLVPLFLLAREFGLVNSLLGLALTYISFALPYALWILRAFFQSIPVELSTPPSSTARIARRPSATWWRPRLPGIIATAIFTFIVAWNDFLFALVLIGRDELKTLAIGINDFFHMAVVDWGLIMAAGVMVTIPALVFFVAIQRYLIAGWGAGGVKG